MGGRRPIVLMRHTLLPRPLASLALATLLFLAACGDTTVTEASTQPPDTEPATVTIAQDGGCQVMGPNCPTFEIDRDGTLRLYRTGQADVVSETTVDPIVIEELWEQIGTVDIADLSARVGPGTCQACVDGVDTVITYSMGGEEIRLDSTVIAFDSSEPFFAVVNETLEAAAEAVSLPHQDR